MSSPPRASSYLLLQHSGFFYKSSLVVGMKAFTRTCKPMRERFTTLCDLEAHLHRFMFVVLLYTRLLHRTQAYQERQLPKKCEPRGKACFDRSFRVVSDWRWKSLQDSRATWGSLQSQTHVPEEHFGSDQPDTILLSRKSSAWPGPARDSEEHFRDGQRKGKI